MKKIIAIFLSLVICCGINPIKVSAKTLPVQVIAPQTNSVNQVFKRLQKDEVLIKEEPKPSYSEEDLHVMSHVISGEAGSPWLPDEEQLLVANVVMNRVNHPNYPKTIKEVVFQKGQYACTWDGNYDRQPDERTVQNAKRILEGERLCPENVIYQSEFKQGPIYKKIGRTYFCHE